MQEHNVSDYMTTVPVCKHFKAYDFEGGTPSGYPADVDRFHVDVNVSKRDMAEYYSVPVKACVVDGGAQAVMCACKRRRATAHVALSSLTSLPLWLRSVCQRCAQLRQQKLSERYPQEAVGLFRLRGFGCRRG